MLLASAPRSTRARWLGVSTLVLAMALVAPSTAGAQDDTVYIGGGSNSQDGSRGVQGGDNVIVNMDAVDGGRGRASDGSGGGMSGGSSRGDSGNQPSVQFGEPYRSPAGAILRFPPQRPPESQLVVDPDQISDRRQASRDGQSSDQMSGQPPARKPERQQPQDSSRTAAASPETDAPRQTQNQPRDSQQAVEVPETPSFEQGGGDGASATAQQSQPQTTEPQPAEPQPAEPQPAEPQPAEPAADGRNAPTQLVARPSRKPEPPQGTQADAQSDAQSSETATASGASSRDTSGPSAPETTQTAASDASADATAPSDTASSGGMADTQNDGATDASTPAESTQAESPATETAAATASDPAGDPGSGTQSADTSEPTSAENAGDTGETQTAALPPEALPDQMRLMFDDGAATLSDDAKQRLDQLAQTLEDNPRQRVQLMAFAQGTEETASQARRLSLSRALAVRTYLIDQGIRSTRMDVRALGATADQGPLDRVDIVPANR